MEAQCFAYLAVRSLRKMPLSLPSTTGVSKPLTGGKIALPMGDHQKSIKECSFVVGKVRELDDLKIVIFIRRDINMARQILMVG